MVKQPDQCGWLSAYVKARGLRQAIAALPFQITASIGTSGVPLDTRAAIADIEIIDDLICASDAAMYEAKRAAGNQVCHHPKLVPPGQDSRRR